MSQFVEITAISDRRSAEGFMEMNPWNLNRAIDLFHQLRHNDSLPKQAKRALMTHDEIEREKKGE